MTKPQIAVRKPAKVNLESGKKYFWCSCGKSATQPFCDGTHKGSGLTPVAFIVDKSDFFYLCQCKRSQRSPFCDGSHSNLK